MNKETGEVNEIFKLDFFSFVFSFCSPPLQPRLPSPTGENYGGNFLHSRPWDARLIGKVGGVYIFSLAFFSPLPLSVHPPPPHP